MPTQLVPPIEPPSSLHATCAPVWPLRMYIDGSKNVLVPSRRSNEPPSLAQRLKSCGAPQVTNQRTSSPEPPPHVPLVTLVPISTVLVVLSPWRRDE